ncbi:hypothetical protein [Actibacterium sp. XHP0104]|uniref:hypothetical protein n=1 Tax=Actibacterium sp. XHP0104 TaxID=2984335 RepID=UPI0021E9563F|nr:hypothetical protein [Actibacterium sp. XHP0104]MCV2883019.1 hypothetical protein [Actibacterium sp. XHP0104]
MIMRGLDIPTDHHRRVWVFAVDIPVDQIDAFNTETYSDDGDHVDWPLAEALGLSIHPDHDFIEIFDPATLKDYGFARYLTEANGMDASEVAPDAAMLNAQSAPVLLVFSQALKGADTAFAPKPPLRFLGSYGLTPTDVPMSDLRSDSAKGQLGQGKPPLSPARARGMGAMFALLFLALAVLLMIWVA